MTVRAMPHNKELDAWVDNLTIAGMKLMAASAEVRVATKKIKSIRTRRKFEVLPGGQVINIFQDVGKNLRVIDRENPLDSL
jgi:hypothetical protein